MVVIKAVDSENLFVSNEEVGKVQCIATLLTIIANAWNIIVVIIVYSVYKMKHVNAILQGNYIKEK